MEHGRTLIMLMLSNCFLKLTMLSHSWPESFHSGPNNPPGIIATWVLWNYQWKWYYPGEKHCSPYYFTQWPTKLQDIQWNKWAMDDFMNMNSPQMMNLTFHHAIIGTKTLLPLRISWSGNSFVWFDKFCSCSKLYIRQRQ